MSPENESLNDSTSTVNMEFSNVKLKPKTDNDERLPTRLDDLEKENKHTREEQENANLSNHEVKPGETEPDIPTEHERSRANDRDTVEREKQQSNNVIDLETSVMVKSESQYDKVISGKHGDCTPRSMIGQRSRKIQSFVTALEKKDGNDIPEDVVKYEATQLIDSEMSETKRDGNDLKHVYVANEGNSQALDTVLVETEIEKRHVESTNSVPKLEIDVDVSDIGYSYIQNDFEMDNEIVNDTETKGVSLSQAGAASAKDRLTEYKRNLGYAESKLQCPVCLKYFKTKKSMRLHKDEVHGDKIYHCVQCDRWFSTNTRFDDHLKLHLNIRPYKCNKCTKSFTAQKYL